MTAPAGVPVIVIGRDGRPLPRAAHDAIQSASLLVGGRRHLSAVHDDGIAHRAECIEIGTGAVSWPDALTRVAAAAGGGQTCAVLASGDPGFFGVVRALRCAGLDVRGWPGASSVAEAFARIGRSWEDATVVSAHGRPAGPALAAARTLPKVAILTGPQAPAELFIDALRAAGRQVWVAERLGHGDERVRRGADCAPPYAEPNVVLGLAIDSCGDHGNDAVRWRSGHDPVPDGWALPEDAFEHRDSMVTKAEVRAVALARLAPRVGQTLWDVGAGSGSVAIECARFGADVIAVERDGAQCDRLRRNARQHGVRIEVVAESAPAALTPLRPPDAVFVGGGGSEVVEHVAGLASPRRVVVALTALERLAPALNALARNNFTVDGVQLHASRLTPLPDGTHRLAATNPVTLVSGVRVIGLVAVTAAGRLAAEHVRTVLERQGESVQSYEGPAAHGLREAFGHCDAVVCFLAVGAAVRLVAPLLTDKAGDPGLVCVDEGSRHAVAVLGGHAGGANALAERVAAVLGARPVVTTATDAVSVPGLDDLGWQAEGDVAALTRALLDGLDVHLDAETAWPLPALGVRPGQVATHPGADYVLHISDRGIPRAAGHVVLRPPSLVLGIGASRGAPIDQVRSLVLDTLRRHGLSPASVGEVVSVDLKSDEVAIMALAADLGVPLRTFAAHDLDAHQVPTPSAAVAAATGTRSVAEASVLHAGAELVVPKCKNAVSTVAVGRRPSRGRLALVGIGPGARDLMAPRAVAELRQAAIVIGLDQYVDQIRDLLRPGTRVLESGLGSEEERARTAVALAQQGNAVAVVGSGDAGVYAMASPTLEALEQALAAGGAPVEVAGVPGITAALAASSALGAALGNDHAYISLSDLHTPWPAIERRLHAVAEGDFVVCLYNPRSSRRIAALPEALRILGARRPPFTPVGVVRNASRPDESVRLSTLAEVDPTDVDMLSVVVVGCSQSRFVDGHLVTPRGYRWLR